MYNISETTDLASYFEFPGKPSSDTVYNAMGVVNDWFSQKGNTDTYFNIRGVIYHIGKKKSGYALSIGPAKNVQKVVLTANTKSNLMGKIYSNPEAWDQTQSLS